jgi:S1-C subfamily serine protease
MDFPNYRRQGQRRATGFCLPWWRLLSAAVLMTVTALCTAAQSEQQPRHMTVDALSVVKVNATTVPDARSASTLGTQREGTGVVIDSNGLVLTIGYLVMEADNIELSTADGKTFPAALLGYDNATGLGLLKALTPLPIKPVDFGESAGAKEREMVLIVGFDGVAPAYIVSKRPFVGYWEYLLDEAIYTAPATVNWQGAALLDREGKLLGIGSLVVSDAVGSHANIPGNVFLPIDLLKPVVGDFVANGHSTAKPRPWLGINTQEVQGHLIVTRVSPESPADNAGLTRGDIIVGISGGPIRNQADFYMKLWRSGDAGVEVMLDVLKGNQLTQYPVKSMARETYLRPKQIY